MKNVSIFIVLVGIFINSCSQDPYEEYIGLWKNDYLPEVIEIKKDGNTYIAFLNILKGSRSKNDRIILSKSEGQLSVKNKFNNITLGLINDGETLIISNKQLSRISQKDFKELTSWLAEQRREAEKLRQQQAQERQKKIQERRAKLANKAQE